MVYYTNCRAIKEGHNPQEKETPFVLQIRVAKINEILLLVVKLACGKLCLLLGLN